MEIEKVVQTVDKVDKTSRVAIVASIIWPIVIAVASNGYRSFDGENFVVVGVLPVVAYWGWRFIKSAKH